MSDQLVVLDGNSFFVSDLRGDAAGTGPAGFLHRDMRQLSRWRLLIAGRRSLRSAVAPSRAPGAAIPERATDGLAARTTPSAVDG